MNEPPIFEVSDAIAVINQSLEYAYPTFCIVGEVSGFKINQNKWVFFDLKDDTGTLSCFMSVFNLRIPLEDGMKVMVTSAPKLTQWGKFSLTVQQVKPVGEGSLKKAFELLRAKLDREGLFAPERKRALPDLPEHIGVISSTDAAGYKDFIKIINSRFSGLKIQVYHTQVQGLDAPDQIMNGLDYFNEQQSPPEVILILRGGGSGDDLAAFNDEPLVRKIAASRVPVLTGIGHEIDTTLADLAADLRASTPSNAAEILVPNKRELIASVLEQQKSLLTIFAGKITHQQQEIEHKIYSIRQKTTQILATTTAKFESLHSLLRSLNPDLVLRRGYALVRDEQGTILRAAPQVGAQISVRAHNYQLTAEVKKCAIITDKE
jgi:exodeoxyribonuclease VII large subunit